LKKKVEPTLRLIYIGNEDKEAVIKRYPVILYIMHKQIDSKFK